MTSRSDTGGEEASESGFVPAPASDPPSGVFYMGARRCAYYEGDFPFSRRYSILTGPGRRLTFADSCKGKAEFVAYLQGWRPDPTPEADSDALPVARQYRRGKQTEIDWSKSPDLRDYYGLKARLERESYAGQRGRQT